ncbi:MAG: AraC family transcriptional regulator [Polyangiaceae bacterium]
MASRPTALASMARYALEAAKASGLEGAELLARAGLAPEIVEDIDGRVPVDRLYRLWELAADGSGDPFYGLHVAERFASPQTIHIVGFAARSAETISEAIATVGRFARVMNETTSFELIRRGEKSSLRVAPYPQFPRWPRVYAELVVAGYLKMGRFFSGGTHDCEGATFQHAAPRDLSEYRRIFGPSVSFEAPTNELRFRSELLDLPVRFADPALADYLCAQAATMLKRLPAAGDLRERVRQVIAERLSNSADIASIARRMGMSTRSLQRALRDEGTSFQEVRDEVRRCVTLTLLHERALSVGEIAARVGFAHTSAFRAAVRRWTGESTRQLRRSLRESVPAEVL